jgi:hypothetical protein
MYDPRAGRADEGDFPLAGHRDARQFSGGIGMSKAPADSAAVADLIMRDVRDGLSQQRMRDVQPVMVLDIAPAHPGAKAEAAVADHDVVEPRNPTQVYEQARRRQPEGKHRHQALPARDYHCIGIRYEKVDRFPESGRSVVFEGGGLHPSPRKAKPT